MTALSTRMFRANIWVLAVALFAISLQVLTTIKVGSTSLRISSSDLLLPVLALMLTVKCAKDGAPRPEWRIRYFWGWLLLLTAWMGVSLVNGRVHSGNWQTWALVNKGIGWLFLLSYLLVGGWMGAFLEVRVRDGFVKTFMLFACGLCACLIVLFSLALYNLIPSANSSTYYPRIAGFFANPNAFGIAMAATAALLTPYLTSGTLFPRRLAYLGMALLCTATVLSISRSAWIGLAIAALTFVVMKVMHWRDLIRVTVLSTVLVVATLYGPRMVLDAIVLSGIFVAAVSGQSPGDTGGAGSAAVSGQSPGDTGGAGSWVSKLAKFTKSPSYLDVVFEKEGSPGISERLASMHVALDAWREAPVIGIGLGTYYQTYRDIPKIPDTIHNTFLWLLTEMGAIGVGLFTAFFLVVLLALVRSARSPPVPDPFVLGVLGILLVFAGASMGTEILYQRYFWFLIGLALVVRPRADSTTGAA